MPLIKELRQGRNKSLNWTHPLGVILVFSLLVASNAPSAAQLPRPEAPPPANAESAVPPAATKDPLERDNPRSAMMGFLKYAGRNDFETAARYLQPTPRQRTDLVQRAKELQALDSKLKISIALLSDDPNGAVENGLPLGEVHAGVLAVDSTTTDVILVRVDDPASGKIWLISKETVAKIPELYAKMQSQGPVAAERIWPAALTSRHLLGISLAQWLAWLLSIPISWALVWLFTFLLSMPRRLWCKFRKVPFQTLWETRPAMPLRCILAIAIHTLFVYQLGLPLLYRAYYARVMAGLLAGCFAWFLGTLADEGFDRAVNRARIQHKGGESILVLMQRLTRIVALIFALVAAFALFGFNVRTALTGLGIGGLAIALAAQKTLENLIGGVSLLMDKAVSVGDLCQIGDQIGIVEDIGLRSLKLRTRDQSLLVIPNGSLAQMQFQNMSSRSKLLINQTFSVRIETHAEQLRFVLARVQTMLDQHPAIEPGSSRVRIMSFVGAAFQLELYAYAKTGDWAQFTVIRQDLILKIAEIVEASGTRFAAPTRLTYQVMDSGVNADEASEPVRAA
jgi:MscS family membrane protein